MNELTSASPAASLIARLDRPQFALLHGPSEPTALLLHAAVRWAARGRAVRVLDGANAFDGYFVARTAYRLSPEPAATLARIRLSRAFTCFQLAQRIETLPAVPEPLIVLGLLATFYDESVPLAESRRLLDQALDRLRALARHAPVVVGAAEPRALVKDRWVLLERAQLAADAEWTPGLPAPATGPVQLSLLEDRHLHPPIPSP